MAIDTPAVKRCRFCGRTPAVDATVRAHRGMIILMQFRSLRGPFCRECGEKAVSKLTKETLWQGWWGVLSFFLGTPFTLLWNLFTLRRIRRLPAPEAVPQPAAT